MLNPKVFSHHAQLSLATILALSLLLMGCIKSGDTETQALKPEASLSLPMRIVSLDYCADQYVLQLADKNQILALSPEASSAYSYMRDAAQGLPTVRPHAEDVLILKPDLIVRSYGGGPNAPSFFTQAGIPVLQVGWTSQLDGDQAGSLTSVIRDMAIGLGQTARGDALINRYRERLDAIPKRENKSSAFYMTSSGVTSGAGSLMHEMLLAAGLDNFQEKPGWHPIPLERLIFEQPDVVAAAFFETGNQYRSIWSAARHPVAQQQLKGANVVALHGAWTACGGWYIMDAIEALATAAQTKAGASAATISREAAGANAGAATAQ